MVRFVTVSMAVALALVFTACGDDNGDTSGTTTAPSIVTTTTTAPAVTTTTTLPAAEPEAVSVYLMRQQNAGEFLAPVYRELLPGQAGDVGNAIDMLMKGETFTEAGIGFGTEIPRETQLSGVTLDGAVAQVDLTGEFDDGGGSHTMRSRLAQVVFTATQFEGVAAVTFAIDGEPVDIFSAEGIDVSEPVTRDAFVDLCPEVMVERPAAGETVSNEFTVTGLMAPPANKWSFGVVNWDGLIIHGQKLDEGADATEWTDFEWDVVLDPAEVTVHPSGFYDLALIMWQGDFGSGPGVEVPLFYLPEG